MFTLVILVSWGCGSDLTMPTSGATPCGPVSCAENQVCCSAACGLCGYMGQVCGECPAPDADAGTSARRDGGRPAEIDSGVTNRCTTGTAVFRNTCAGIDPCGGPLSGPYCVSTVCFSPRSVLGPQTNNILSLCPDLVLSGGGTAEGSLEVVSDSTLRRTLSLDAQATMEFTASCVNGDCGVPQLALRAFLAPITSAPPTCTRQGPKCVYNIEYDLSEDLTAAFEVDDGTLNLDSRPFDYCATESALTMFETRFGSRLSLTSR